MTKRIRIKLESFNSQLLVLSCNKIINLIKNIQVNSVRIVTLPTNKRIYCVLRSPHVNKDSREHFEIRVHKRLLEINYDYDNNLYELLKKSDLPSGVGYYLYL